MKVQLPGDTGFEIWSEDYNALSRFVDFIIPWILDKKWIEQDNAKYERWKNMQHLLLEAKSLTEGSKIFQPPLKIAEPLLEYASLESEIDLQTKWAQLLSNALLWKDIATAYIEILKELSALEVKILDKMYEDIQWEITRNWGNFTDMQIESNSIIQLFRIDKVKMFEIIDNLKRLNLIESPAVQWIAMWWFSPTGHTRDVFQITFLGLAFIKACRK